MVLSVPSRRTIPWTLVREAKINLIEVVPDGQNANNILGSSNAKADHRTHEANESIKSIFADLICGAHRTNVGKCSRSRKACGAER